MTLDMESFLATLLIMNELDYEIIIINKNVQSQIENMKIVIKYISDCTTQNKRIDMISNKQRDSNLGNIVEQYSKQIKKYILFIRDQVQGDQSKEHQITMIEQRQNIDILFLGTITHEGDAHAHPQAHGGQKMNYQDQISFNDPVLIELIRIPNYGKQMYGTVTSQTQVPISLAQKQPIKSMEIYYRNLDKKMARYSLLVSSSSQLLVSSSIDILVTMRETIYTDLLVIRGNFTNITFCIYGKVLHQDRGPDREQIQKKCPYYKNNIDFLGKDESSGNSERNVFDQSRKMVKAIQDEYSSDRTITRSTDRQIGQQMGEQTERQMMLRQDNTKMIQSWNGYSNDKQLFQAEIANICKLSQQFAAYENEDIKIIQQRSIAEIRLKLQTMQSYLSKLFKSARIGLYYPSPYRSSSIPSTIPDNIVKITTKLLNGSLSDQYRALEILKLILQLEPHAQYFIKIGGIQALIRLFLEFFNSNLVILSSLKLLAVQVFIVLSFWHFSASQLVDALPPAIYSQYIEKQKNIHEKQKQRGSLSSQQEDSNDKSRSPSRSRQKQKQKQKKKKNQGSQSKSNEREKDKERDRKKSKKSKKTKKNKSRERSKSKSRDKIKQKQKQKEKQKDKRRQKQKQRERQKQRGKQKKSSSQQANLQKLSKQSQQPQGKLKIQECKNFYEIIFKTLRTQKNTKIQHLLRILILQLTQTLTKNILISNQMASYTPLLRDTKYMFNQSGEMINSKSLKIYASYYPFLNYWQSLGIKQDSRYLCESEKIKKGKIPAKLFKLIDSAITIIQSKTQTENQQIPTMLDEQFMTLMSALIQNNKSGVSIGIGQFIDAIRIDNLLTLKKQQAVIAILCEYIHEVMIEDQGYNLIFYLDQIHNSMLKIINWLKQDKTFSLEIKRKVQYLINSALIYNYFTGTENNFKNFSEYFIKLIGHQNLDINKILEYRRKQQFKTVNPLNYQNLSQNFSLGNFYDVLPAQPLLQISICLRACISILNLNKNIWPTFYEYKFPPSFASLYLKIHSLLKFYMNVSLQLFNCLVSIKVVDRLVINYLTVLKQVVTIFKIKLGYQAGFNQLGGNSTTTATGNTSTNNNNNSNNNNNNSNSSNNGEQDDIYDSIELYEKWADTYVFLYTQYHRNQTIYSTRTKSKIKQVLQNFIQLFETIIKGYEITNANQRYRNIKSLLKYVYRMHYAGIGHRGGVLALFGVIVRLTSSNNSNNSNSNNNVCEILLQKNQKNQKQKDDILLPDNSKSIFQNILRTNMYRSDPIIAHNISNLIASMLQKQPIHNKICEILQIILQQNEQSQKQALQQIQSSSLSLSNSMSSSFSFPSSSSSLPSNLNLSFQKSILYARILSNITIPFTIKIEHQIFRLLKLIASNYNTNNIGINSNYSTNNSNNNSNNNNNNNNRNRIGNKNNAKLFVNNIRLRNYYLGLIKNMIVFNGEYSGQQFGQFVKIVNGLLAYTGSKLNSNNNNGNNQNGNAFDQSDQRTIRIQQLKCTLICVESLAQACKNLIFQSIILYGEYTEKPTKILCEINLQPVLNNLRQLKISSQIIDETESLLMRQIARAILYLFCKLTTIDGYQFYSTQIRKNALQIIASPNRLFTLREMIGFLGEIVQQPEQFRSTLQNYLQYPIIQKPQVLPPSTDNSNNKKQATATQIVYSKAALFSKGVFSMISENDPVGKTRYELIQDKWQGGDVSRSTNNKSKTYEGVYRVNLAIDTKPTLQNILDKIQNIDQLMGSQQQLDEIKYAYQGIHDKKQVNNLFQFKIKKIFAQQAKKNTISANSSIIMKNIPAQIKKPETIKQNSYQAKLNSSPSLNRNNSGGMGQSGANNAQSSSGNMMVNKPNYVVGSGSGSSNLNSTANSQQPSSSIQVQQQTPPVRSHSNSNNRQPSPYTSTSGSNLNKSGSNSNQNMSKTPYSSIPTSTNVYASSSVATQPSMNVTSAQNTNSYYGSAMGSGKGSGMYASTGQVVTGMGGKNYPMYDQPTKPVYDGRNYYPPSTGYDPRIQAPMNYQPQPTPTYSTPTSSIPPYVSTIRPPTSYPPPYSNPPTTASYPSTSTHHGYGLGVHPAPTIQHPHGGRLMEQNMINQAINILLYLQQNPNVPDKDMLKGKVNKLFQTPNVHDRVTQYFQQAKRN